MKKTFQRWVIMLAMGGTTFAVGCDRFWEEAVNGIANGVSAGFAAVVTDLLINTLPPEEGV